ncbi:TRAPP trafficking subunit Trs65-domain-containing protein [Xylariaceae sp. FL0662B]|nr:TRAPP trafficking subunit Trs65-domain-containing protein [Xylariaceae sp. FL0662B]
MAAPAVELSSKGSDFLDNSSLTYFIPLATDFKPEESFNDVAKEHRELFDTVEQRESLFFDESVDVYLVLRAPYVDEDTIRSSIRRLFISLEAQIVNENASDREGAPASESIYTGTVDDSQEPMILYDPIEDDDGGSEDSSQQYVNAIWKLSVFLGRPRMRLQSPSVVFTASASLRPADQSLSDGLQDGYMPSCIASGLNLLESFGHDSAMGGIKPRLSALRVSRVAPITQQAKDLLRPIKSSPKISLRIDPAVHARIRFTHPNVTPSTATVIAMLEIDFTPFFDCEILLDGISLSVPDGVVEDLTKQAGLTLPLSCVAHDHITFLYRIVPTEADVILRNPMRQLGIAISATALVQPDICSPHLSMAWAATVDFTVPVNPGFGSTMQPIQRAHRPSQLSIGGESTTSFTAPSVSRPDSIPSLEAATLRTELGLPDIGITMTFIAPPTGQKIFAGDEFVWNVFVVNRSSVPTSAPRKLAIVVIPKRRRNESRVNRPPSLSRPPEALHSAPHQPRDRSVADAVLDENVVHAMQHGSFVDISEVVCLSADVRVGPLAPGACHVVELRFLALKEGIVNVEAVRVIDLGSNEHVDIRELPVVVIGGRTEA